MSAPRVAVDGLWRSLCPSFDSIVLSRSRLPVSRASYLQCARRRRGGLVPSTSASSHSSRRQNSTLANPLNNENPADAGLARNKSRIKSHPSNAETWDALSLEELHDVLRTLRDESGSYQKTIDLVRYLIKCRGERPNVRHFDALIRANADAERGSAEEVEELFKQMDKEGIIGDSGLYHGILTTLAVHPNHLLRAEILSEMKARWISLSPLGYHHLIISHLRDREYELALSVLSSLHHRHVTVEPWLYDILIYVFCEAGELSTALSLLQSRAEDPDRNPLYQDPTDVSPGVWPHFLDACAAAYYYPGVLYIWRKRVEVEYLRPSDGTLTNILNTAALSGDPALATSALKMLADRRGELPTSSYEAMLEAYATAKDVMNAFRVLSIMEKAGRESPNKTPSSATTRPLFKLLREGDTAGIEEAWAILKTLQSEGNEIPIASANVIIEAAASSGDQDFAMRLYEELIVPKSVPTLTKTADTNSRNQTSSEALRMRPDTATMNILLQGCRNIRGEAGPKQTAMYLASEMARQGIRPDELTYDRLILVCLDERQRNYDDAFRYIDEMTDVGWRAKVRMGTWRVLVKRCAMERDDRVNEVLEMMEDLGLETERLKQDVDRLWKIGPGDRASVTQVVDEMGVSEHDDTDEVAVEIETESGLHRPQDEPPVWGNLRRKPGSTTKI